MVRQIGNHVMLYALFNNSLFTTSNNYFYGMHQSKLNLPQNKFTNSKEPLNMLTYKTVDNL